MHIVIISKGKLECFNIKIWTGRDIGNMIISF